MKELIKQYLDDGMSRRQLMTGLSALGMSTAAVRAMAQSLAPVTEAPAAAMREVAAPAARCSWRSSRPPGSNTCFNPSTGDYPIFDALVDEPDIQVIKGYSRGRRGRHGGRLCEGHRQAWHRHRRQCRTDQRHDPDD